MSQIEVDKIIPQSGTALQVGDSGDTITVPAGATFDASSGTLTLPDGSVVNAKLANSSITINGSAVSLGGSVTIGETKPTISSINPSVIENTQTAVTITGTNFVSVPTVEAISSTGAITRADTVSFTSATTIVANFTLPTDGTYFIRVENNDGNAVRSSSALLTVSDAPAWTTAAGSWRIKRSRIFNFIYSSSNKRYIFCSTIRIITWRNIFKFFYRCDIRYREWCNF